MQIRTRLILAALAPALMALIIGGGQLVAQQSVIALEQRQATVRQLGELLEELSDLAHQYVLHHEERPKQQFLAEYEHVTRLIAAVTLQDEQQQQHLRRLAKHAEVMKTLFLKTVLEYQRHGTLEEDALLHDAEERLVGQLLIRARDAKARAATLEALIDLEAAESRRQILLLALALVIAVAASLTLLLLGLMRTISTSISKLMKGTEIIGSGNLDHRIDMATRDEIGLLSRAFDRMTANLQSITVSRNELAAEIEERKRAQEELRQQREWLRVTITSIGDAVLAVDTAGRVTFVNPVAAELTGWSQAEAPGQPVTEVFRIINEKTRATAEDIVGRVLREGCVVALANHTALLSRDGRETAIEDSAAPIKDQAGKVIGVVLVFHDVTEKRRALDALRASEERYRLISENTGDVIWTLDIASQRFTFVSPSVQRLRGYSPQEVMAQPLEEALTPESLRATVAEIPQRLAAFLAGDESARTQVHQVDQPRKDGSIVPTEVVTTILCDKNGQPEAFLGVSRDITVRKQAEQALLDADRRKNEFLAMLSHELRNPLTPIRNSLTILERAPPGGEQAQKAHAIINRQVTHLVRLVDDLLDVTRITSGKTQIRRERMEVNDLVKRTADDHRTFFATFGVNLEVTLAPEPMWLLADPTRISQVIGNLLHNAAKFTSRHGRVELVVSREEATSVIVVRDTGAGIPSEMLTRIFEPFIQSETTLDRSRGGLGLGLTLAKGLVELHGGKLTASSDGPDRGSTFTVKLPLDALPATDAAKSISASQVSQQPLRVLIIEDNVDAAESLRDALVLSGHEVAMAHNGAEGIKMAVELRPAVIFCDIGLPGMDGYAVARELRMNESLRDVFLVALTGYGLPEDLRKAADAGFHQHIVKPPSMEKLDQVLSNARVS